MMRCRKDNMNFANKVIGGLTFQEECTWNSLIIRHVNSGQLAHALNLYHKMQGNGLNPSSHALVAILKACTQERNIEMGLEIHDHVDKRGILERNVFLGSVLINMYAKCGPLSMSERVFEKILERNVVLWNAFISGYIDHDCPSKAFHCFQQMQCENILPDATTFVYILKACASIRSTIKALEVHSIIIGNELLENDTFLCNTLIDIYAKCGCLVEAKEILVGFEAQNIVSWNALISGYLEHGLAQEALMCFYELEYHGIFPDAVTFVSSLKSCSILGNSITGQQLYSEITKRGLLEVDSYIGSALIDMYIKFKMFSSAELVIHSLPYQDCVTWNTLITGYIENGFGDQAFHCIDEMHEKCVNFDSVTLICSLKACCLTGATFRGRAVFIAIVLKGFERDPFISSTLIDMYCNFGLLEEAHKVFDSFPVQYTVMWNAIMSGFLEHGYVENVIDYYEQMLERKISFNVITFLNSLKACGNAMLDMKVQQIHADMTKVGISDRDSAVGSSLIDAYSKIGLVIEAQNLFNRLLIQDEVNWTTMIAGLVESEHMVEAINCFEKLLEDGLSIDNITIGCILRACNNNQFINESDKLYALLIKKGALETDTYVGSILISTYMKQDRLMDAQNVFDNLRVRDVDSWTALMVGYTEHAMFGEAAHCFEQLKSEGVSPCGLILDSILKACANTGDISKGTEVHAEIVRVGLEREQLVSNSLIDMYSKFRSVVEAEELFNGMTDHDTFSWNTLLGTYIENKDAVQALQCFEQMQLKSSSPNAATYFTVLRASGIVGTKTSCYGLHSEISRKGLDLENLISNGLVDMYVKCGLLCEAQDVFDRITGRVVISWNVLISGYAECHNGNAVIDFYEAMQLDGISTDSVTIICTLRACACAGAKVKGQQIHIETVKKGLEEELQVGNTLIDMYVKCGLLEAARNTFDKLSLRDIVSWTTLISGYTGHGYGEEAIHLFQCMEQMCIIGSVATLVCVLKACGSVGASIKGREIHAAILCRGLDAELLLSNTLINMYTRYGFLQEAEHHFHTVPDRDLITWNSLIRGYAQLGDSENVFAFFNQMVKEGITPNAVTFIIILNTCSHAGLLDSGQMFFKTIISEHIPISEHYSCLVDLLGRSGNIQKAMSVIVNMPIQPSVMVWHSIMGACQKWENVEIGQYVFKHAVRLDDEDSSAYVSMFNIYAQSVFEEDIKD